MRERERERQGQKWNFVVFKEFKDAAVAQAMISGQQRLLLAAAVATQLDIVENGYEIEKISK